MLLPEVLQALLCVRGGLRPSPVRASQNCPGVGVSLSPAVFFSLLYPLVMFEKPVSLHPTVGLSDLAKKNETGEVIQLSLDFS